METLIVLAILGQTVAGLAALVKFRQIRIAWTALAKKLSQVPEPTVSNPAYRYVGDMDYRRPDKRVLIDMAEPASPDQPWRGSVVFNQDGTTQPIGGPNVGSS
jgi:hypothetical protein